MEVRKGLEAKLERSLLPPPLPAAKQEETVAELSQQERAVLRHLGHREA